MSGLPKLSSVRVRLVGAVLLAIAPAWVVMYLFAYDPPWMRFALGLLALGAAWVGGERFILRQVRTITGAAERLAAGDYSSRTQLGGEQSELGELARAFDEMADVIEEQAGHRDQAEKTLTTRSLQQTVIGALGQFALVSNDFEALLNQAVMMAAQTLEVEYCGLLELEPGGGRLWLRAGVGWKPEVVGKALVPRDIRTVEGYTLTAGEPVVVENFGTELRFRGSRLLQSHGVVSGVTVAIVGQGQSFGVLGGYSTRRRKFTEDEVHFLLAVATVLAMAAERRRAEADMEKLAAFAQLNPNPAMELTEAGDLTYANEAACKLAGAVGRGHPRELLPGNVRAIVHACLTRRDPIKLEAQLERRTLQWSFYPVFASRVVQAYVEDITARLSLEAQLRQSQKMESVGQLAAGVAHDFNNMLTIIQGHAGMLMAKAGGATAPLESAQAIYFASERAAGLTRQLLMFSRKNVMQPRLTDLREVVLQTSKLLTRLLGETIWLEYRRPPEPATVHGDTGMLEQVIMNLAVNARDAMPRGGKLSIQVENLEIDEPHTLLHPESRPGPFVCLSVKDTGCGMDAPTLARIFEPFFTTKEVGKGTGLGLATVYGIVKQHEGWVEVASEPGVGSTFSVYLPACLAPLETPEPPAPATITTACGGRETILLVEDEPVLRELATMILTAGGHEVLEADNGREALKIWEANRHRIDLLLTDMVMPEGISGMELATRLRATKPELKIVIASGYSMDDLDTEFVQRGNAIFLQKPYTHVTLAQAIRTCLDRKAEERPPG